MFITEEVSKILKGWKLILEKIAEVVRREANF